VGDSKSEYIVDGLDGLGGIKNQVGLVLGLPFGRKQVRREWAHAMMTVAWPVNTTVLHSITVDMPIANARNLTCQQALEVGAKYVWFVDDDTVVPQASIRMLMYELEQHPEAIAIGGIYCAKTDPPQPMVFQELGQGSFWDWTVGHVFECAGIGTGCMLVRVEALKSIEQPWFQTTDELSQTQGRIQETDDIYFCKKARKQGFKILAHGGVLCHHWDNTTDKVYKLPEDSRPFLNANKKEN
jgi:hypothetical protein